MKTLGIIAEYNPFHLGHKYLIKKAKEITKADRVVIIMSGNSVQRGDFAIVDKFVRAKEAVLNGADLVIELPFCFSSQSAEHFARGSVYILDKIGIDYLCFGSEDDDLENKKNIAEVLVNEEKIIFDKTFRDFKNNSALDRQKRLEELYKDEIDFSIMNNSNNILAIEYIKAIKKFDSKIEPISIRRVGNDYHDKEIGNIFSSATSIRTLVKSKERDILEELKRATTKNMAGYVYQNRENTISFDDYFDELKATIIREENLDEIFEVNEGIENLISKQILKSKNLEDMIFAVKSKRYTYTRVRRILFNILLGLKKSDMKKILEFDEKVYTRVLAFNDNGRKILKEIKEREENKIDVITKLADLKIQNETQSILYKYDTKVNKLYYAKHKVYKNNKRVVVDEELSPEYVKTR